MLFHGGPITGPLVPPTSHVPFGLHREPPFSLRPDQAHVVGQERRYHSFPRKNPESLISATIPKTYPLKTLPLSTIIHLATKITGDYEGSRP
jgi:hypothetical protein